MTKPNNWHVFCDKVNGRYPIARYISIQVRWAKLYLHEVAVKGNPVHLNGECPYFLKFWFLFSFGTGVDENYRELMNVQGWNKIQANIEMPSFQYFFADTLLVLSYY